MTEFHQFDVARLRYGLSEYGLAPGTLVVVIDLIEEPHLHYEIEVVDTSGRTIFQGAVTPEQLEPVED